MRWRLLPFARHSAAVNMAIDEAVAESIGKGASLPTIRFYGWEPSAVSIGCFQSFNDEVDERACSLRGVDVVRRRTGGGAVYHDRDGEITYSVIAPLELMGEDITSSYQEVCGWVIDALRALGIEPEYRPINDITVGGKKISGCAQTRREGTFLQHGTILYAADREVMFSLLKVSAEKLSDKALAEAGGRITSVSELTSASRSDLLAALQSSFCRWKEWYERPLTPPERSRAAALARDRYGDPAWTRSR